MTNTGNTVLENVVVTDDLGTADPGDDLSTPATITCPLTTLAPSASMTCTSTTPAAALAAQYANTADVVGDPVLPPIPWSDPSYEDLVRLDGSPFYDGTGAIIPVTDDDPSHYFGAIATIDIEKATNTVPADGVGTLPAGPVVPTLDPVTWTYVVTIPAAGQRRARRRDGRRRQWNSRGTCRMTSRGHGRLLCRVTSTTTVASM